MPKNLVRYQQSGDVHFVTFSCYHRQAFLGDPTTRTRFEHSLEKIRIRYDFRVFGYVVMPEHVHLLLTEPKKAVLETAIQALKLSVTVKQSKRPFWQVRYYDFNVFTQAKHTEKLKYIHRNPVTRRLVQKKEDWEWSSYRHYATGERGIVEIESWWTTTRREQTLAETHVSESRHGAPAPALDILGNNRAVD